MEGRSCNIVTIPSKPISTGYKVWAIAQTGYILGVLYHRIGKGPVGSKVPEGSGINPTQAVVVTLLQTLLRIVGPSLRYCVYLDNLFTSTTLLLYYGVLDTVQQALVVQILEYARNSF